MGLAATLLPVVPAPAAVPSGGAGLGGPRAPNRVPPPPVAVAPAPGPHTAGAWLRRVTITEYWPAPEAWFVGRLVSAPGLPGKHRVDWLYSAAGVSMQGEGLGLDGRIYHIAAAGLGGWVTAAGRSTSPADDWAAGPPFWRAGGFWRTPLGAVTFPLALGGWSAASGGRYVPLAGVSFALGAARPLRFYQSIAVDPRIIPLGSRVYIPAYRNDGYGGWFIAQDTGGAVTGRHVDVFRSPPPTPGAAGQYLAGQAIFVIRPRG